jgi:hypothetical protein
MEKYRSAGQGRMEAVLLAKSATIASISARSYGAWRRLIAAKDVMRVPIKELIKCHHVPAWALRAS